MDTVEVEGVYLLITYEASGVYERDEQRQVFCDILEPLGLVYAGSGCFLGAAWEQIDLKIPVGTDLRTIHDALAVDLGFAFVTELEDFSED
jgi:hypothetical protein